MRVPACQGGDEALLTELALQEGQDLPVLAGREGLRVSVDPPPRQPAVAVCVRGELRGELREELLSTGGQAGSVDVEFVH